jgi:hypothetical protein
MPPSVHVVECIEDEIEPGEPFQVEPFVFDIGMVCDKFDIRIEPARYLFCDERLRLLDVFVSKKELTVQVAQIDRVKVYDVYFAKPGEDKILEQLAADAARADKKNPGLK